MLTISKLLKVVVLISIGFGLCSCNNNANVYASVGVSSGFSSYHHGHRGHSSGPRMRGSISVGGRIR